MKYFILVFLFFFGHGCASISDDINKKLASGDIESAKQIVDQMSKSDPEYSLKDYFEAQIYFNQGNYEKAQKSIEKVLKSSPTAEVYSLAGGIYGMRAATAGIFSKLGFAKKSKKNLLKAFQMEPTNKDYIIGLLQFNMQAPGIAGGDSDQIEPLLAQLSKVDAKKAIEIRTNYLAQEEGFDEALAYINAQIVDDSESVDLLYYKAFLFENSKKNDDAMIAYADVIAMKPHDGIGYENSNWERAHYRFGRLASINKKKLSEAKGYFLTFLDFESTQNSDYHAWAHYRLGLVYQHMNDKSNAQLSFDKARSLKPSESLLKLLNDI